MSFLPTSPLPELTIGSVHLALPIIQGGMGVGVSGVALAAAVSLAGGLGTLSSACLDRLVSTRMGRRIATREAAAIEVRLAKGERNLPVAMNVMVALASDYEDSVLGALDGGVDVIISGAGLPLKLPSIVATHPRGAKTALVPIVSSGRALELLCRRWEKAGRLPDAVVVEGPMAGGHLGWKTREEIENPACRLEAILDEVLETVKKFGDIPVIAAGGVYTHEDIREMIGRGAAGVQMGTRFVATKESGASEEYKRAVVDCTEDDIIVAVDPGSPCGLPFRTLRSAPMYVATLAGSRTARCDKGYLLYGNGCAAKNDPNRYFCICNGLLSSAGNGTEGEPPLYTLGSNAHRVDNVVSVEELMRELAGPLVREMPSFEPVKEVACAH